MFNQKLQLQIFKSNDRSSKVITNIQKQRQIIKSNEKSSKAMTMKDLQNKRQIFKSNDVFLTKTSLIIN